MFFSVAQIALTGTTRAAAQDCSFAQSTFVFI
jgi:hypothetical protein